MPADRGRSVVMRNSRARDRGDQKSSLKKSFSRQYCILALATNISSFDLYDQGIEKIGRDKLTDAQTSFLSDCWDLKEKGLLWTGHDLGLSLYEIYPGYLNLQPLGLALVKGLGLDAIPMAHINLWLTCLFTAREHTAKGGSIMIATSRESPIYTQQIALMKKKDWVTRRAHRSDLSTRLVHFIRSTETASTSFNAVSVLLEILAARKLKGSDSSSGYITGSRTAVCFQDVPLSAAAQNIYLDRQVSEKDPDMRVHVGFGPMFEKPYIFKHGGRPVIYEQKKSKKILPEKEYWRIVSLDLSSDDLFVDWTHEREWRIRDDFSFDLMEATVVLADSQGYRDFMRRCLAGHQDILNEIAGIVNLNAVFD